MSSGHSHKHY